MSVTSLMVVFILKMLPQPHFCQPRDQQKQVIEIDLWPKNSLLPCAPYYSILCITLIVNIIKTDVLKSHPTTQCLQIKT